ncbi:MAG TPA: amidohydrolase family protein [Chloroflexota bacterium]
MSTSERVDVSAILAVDNHAHALMRRQPQDIVSYRAHFTEAHDPSLAREHVGSSVQYRWAIRQLAGFLDVELDESAVLARRTELGLEELAGRLAAASGLDWLLLDEGFPPADLAYSSEEMAALLGVRIGRILRIETLVQDLIVAHDAWTAIAERFDRTLDEAWRTGYVALKSIAAYRTGLAIERVDEADAEQAWREVQTKLREPFRLASKPLIDYFIWRGVYFAAHHALPMQFHTGYGDPDLDLRLANPLHLRSLFEDAEAAAAPIVLLHESYPYTAEAAYLAAVYPNVYLDLAFSLPPIGKQELTRCVRIALGTAPATKLLYSSDGVGIPEHYWLAAERGRACLSDVLTESVAGGELDPAEAHAFARLILHDNAMRVYDLSGERVHAGIGTSSMAQQ